MATAGAPRSQRWLFGPAPDLLFGCGLLYAIAFAAYSLAGPAIRSVTPSYWMPLLILALSFPHYGGTLVRVYEQRRDRQAYALFALWVTLAMIPLFFAALRSALLASILFTLYLTWSPWHYTGQNYGIAVMFLRRRGVDVTPQTKRWLYAAFILSFLLTAIVSHLEVGSAYSPFAYSSETVVFLPLGIPRVVGDVVLSILGVGYLVSLVESAVRLRRVAHWRDLVPASALVLTQALWFSLPFSVHYWWRWQTGLEPLDAQERIGDYQLMIFAAHGLQYLWITTYFARASGPWSGYATYWAKAAASGIAVWMLPAVLIDPTGLANGPGRAGNVFLVIATFVNLHHFVLDGAIWKLRHSRIGSVLIRSAPEVDAATAPGSPWLRNLVWTAAGAGLLVGALGFYLVRIDVPAAIARGDLVRAESGVRFARWLGADEPALRDQLTERFTSEGRIAHAAAHVERLLALRPDGGTYALLGELEMVRGKPEAARAAFETALARRAPGMARVHMRLARLALARGEDPVAEQHYRSALALRPSSRSVANQLARLLATSADPTVRKVSAGTAIAEGLVQADEQPAYLDTLAAAYAADRRFDDAVRTATRAAELAGRDRDPRQLAVILRHLDRYRAHQTAAPM
jgi:cytochrome c-type biogenesis protein CcmH/NrfG